jgi:hypothetical protein
MRQMLLRNFLYAKPQVIMQGRRHCKERKIHKTAPGVSCGNKYLIAACVKPALHTI